MREISILGSNRFETFTKTRSGCRAVVIRNGEILLTREDRSDLWLIPGGGLEEGETLEQCCRREAEEETGLLVAPDSRFLVMYEYYEEYRYISHYYLCHVTGKGQMRLTEQEKLRGLRPVWLPVQEALAIFSRYDDYTGEKGMKRGLYLREYTALKEVLGIGG